MATRTFSQPHRQSGGVDAAASLSTPVCNTGVLPEHGLGSVSLDWLSATSDCSPDRLRSVINDLVFAKENRAVARETRPNQAFGSAIEWVKDDKRLAVVQWGGVNHDRPHVTVPGTGGLSGFIRTELGTTGYGFTSKASRVDVALDFRGVPFAFLSALCGTPSKTIRNADADKGDTDYFGSRQSRHFVRVYEKGKQMGLDALADWVRVEVEVKPDKPAGRVAAMTATLPELVRSGRVGRSVADAVGLEPEALKMGAAVQRVPHDLLKRLAHMRRQYGATLRELGQLCGEDLDLFVDVLFYAPDEATMSALVRPEPDSKSR